MGGNPLLGIDGTIVAPDWLNNLQEEVALFLEGEGLTLDQTGLTLTQLTQAILLAIYRRTGGRLAFTAAGNLTAGDPLLLVDTFGVVESTVTTGNPAAIILRGTFTLPKAAGTAWSIGQALYWNGTALTTVSSGNRKVGVAAAAALSAATSGSALLGGPPNLV